MTISPKSQTPPSALNGSVLEMFSKVVSSRDVSSCRSVTTSGELRTVDINQTIQIAKADCGSKDENRHQLFHLRYRWLSHEIFQPQAEQT